MTVPPQTVGARSWRAALLAGALAGCVRQGEPLPVVPPLPEPATDSGRATPRISGPVAGREHIPQVAVSSVPGVRVSPPGRGAPAGGGAVQLDFADTDIRVVVSQILGDTLHATYTIDPQVHGTATLRTVQPLATSQLIPVLQSLLQQNGATLVQSGGVYRVLPVTASAGMAGGPGTAGGMLIPLRYASAEDLAKALQPYAAGGAKVVGVPASNSVLVTGEPAQRDALAELIRAFDVDELAGQSYALFPAQDGNAQELAQALEKAFSSQQGGHLSNVVRVIPMPRVNSVLVVANERAYVDDARRAYAVIERGRRQSTRTWHVYYLENSTSNDIAYVLQQAFTPGNVTAQPTATGAGTPGGQSGQNGINGVAGLGGGSTGSASSSLGLGGSSGSSGLGGSSSGLGGSSGGGLGSGLSGGLTGGTTGSGAQGAPVSAVSGTSQANPLLGGLSASGGSGGENAANTMRIIPNPQNNAILVYGTPDETNQVEAMLHKIDILPLQVRIDAIIAEVTLTDDLQYGTQWFFRHHAINGGLTAGTLVNGLALPATGGLSGFVFQAAGKDGDFVIDALQDITTVKVLSSPELLVLDNETAQLQVGNLVPYLTGTASVLTAGTSVVNSVDYRETGVITQVTPRVNSGGLVTLDIAQEVSGVVPQNQASSASGSTINSPTFTDRAVKSRVVVQDGQTVGLAGLITDNVSRSNSGIPFLKDLPIIGAIAGNQSNTRTRTELLVLLTPHVLHDQRDARALTQDLRDQLPRAAAAPYDLQALPPGGSSDPNQKIRARLNLAP
jgi:general secretion pathway protein D